MHVWGVVNKSKKRIIIDASPSRALMFAKCRDAWVAKKKGERVVKIKIDW